MFCHALVDSNFQPDNAQQRNKAAVYGSYQTMKARAPSQSCPYSPSTRWCERTAITTSKRRQDREIQGWNPV
ncbi:hypothetical protein RRG08_012147 [Elysia crispata]|uniref:Uncharacterized protein n=1 Tax=Elysia crispata TaxID=231223 RepID=A0AAE0ZJ64_9GAST|nr:hypothetical protein RRG08_012147 [Elysia crispata]